MEKEPIKLNEKEREAFLEWVKRYSMPDEFNGSLMVWWYENIRNKGLNKWLIHIKLNKEVKNGR